MSQNQFADHVNTQLGLYLLENDHPPYRHIDPLSQSTVSRILAGSFIPDADTLYRIARFGFDFDLKQCNLLEDIRYEAFLLFQREKRTTQQMAVVSSKAKIAPEPKEEPIQKIPDWIFA